jgi:hypothetical protein
VLKSIIKLLRKFRRNEKAVSNVLVVVLSLTILVVVVSKVVLWSYEINSLDWEKIREDLAILNVVELNISYSTWFTAEVEYQVNLGSRVSGTYYDTKAADGDYESFREGSWPPTYRMDINGTFAIDLNAYPLSQIQTVEVQILYRASDSLERWYLKAYNWTLGAYADSGFNNTLGHVPSTGWDYYAVNFTDKWQSYVRNGLILIKFHDGGNDAVQTSIEVDFLGVRVVTWGVSFSFKNRGPLTAQIVSLWITNSTIHKRFDVNVFVNAGENETYVLTGARLPNGPYVVKAVTKRGNIAVFSTD